MFRSYPSTDRRLVDNYWKLNKLVRVFAFRKRSWVGTRSLKLDCFQGGEPTLIFNKSGISLMFSEIKQATFESG